MISATEEMAVREWVKVPNIPGLYRNAISGRYYGFKKIRGRRRERSLRTTDRKIAERRHREWITNLQRVDRECERMTLRELLDRFVAVNQGRSLKTQGTNDSIIQKIMKTWPGGIDIEVRHIRPSHLDEWLALHEQRLKNTSYNRYAGLVKQLFEIAVKATARNKSMHGGWAIVCLAAINQRMNLPLVFRLLLTSDCAGIIHFRQDPAPIFDKLFRVEKIGIDRSWVCRD